MKKLLFTLVATAACGAVSAAVENFSQYTQFSAATNTAGEVSGENPGNWTINMSTDPEMLITNNVADTTTGNYLQINTGSTPLWRTFANVTSVADATSGVPQATTIEDGTVVSSKVKLTACTEWPELESFWGEKLALFLYAPEDEAAEAAHSGGLYAVGGTWITVDNQQVFTNKAYKLAVTGDITNNFGWAKIDIKAYTNVLSVASSYSGFIVAVNGNLVTVETDETDYIGLGEQRTLSNAAKARFDAKELILAAATGQFAGLGFQGEGGIDDVDLAAAGINDMKDAVTMTVEVTGAEFSGIELGANGAYSFTSSDEVTITLTDVANKIVTVNYANAGEAKATYNAGTVTFTPVKDAKLTITVQDAKFEIGGVKYADFAAVLTAIENGTITGGEIDLLADASAGEDGLEFENGTFTIDLNGFTLSAVEDGDAIFNNGASLTIIDSSELKTGVVDGTVLNSKGTLVIEAGTFNDEITNNGTSSLTINGGKFEVALVNKGTLTDNGGKFKVTVGLPEVTGKEYRDDNSDGYYMLEDVAGEGDDTEGPSVGEGEGSVTVDETSGDATVAPAEGKTEVTITLPTGFTGNVIVPSSLDKIVGVPAGKLVIKSGSFDVTGAFSYDATTGAIALDEAGSVTIDDEEIPVKPALADGTDETPFEVGANGPEANVKAIPGLTYELILSDSVNGTYGSIVEGGDKTKVKATGKRVNLKDGRANRGAKGFYKVMVTK